MRKIPIDCLGNEIKESRIFIVDKTFELRGDYANEWADPDNVFSNYYIFANKEDALHTVKEKVLSAQEPELEF